MRLNGRAVKTQPYISVENHFEGALNLKCIIASNYSFKVIGKAFSKYHAMATFVNITFVAIGQCDLYLPINNQYP